jgi:hypothetical protein
MLGAHSLSDYPHGMQMPHTGRPAGKTIVSLNICGSNLRAVKWQRTWHLIIIISVGECSSAKVRVRCRELSASNVYDHDVLPAPVLTITSDLMSLFKGCVGLLLDFCRILY